MKKRIPAMATVLILALCAGLPAGAESRETASGPDLFALAGTTINVYNWGEYISDGSDDSLDVNRQFTKETGIKVNYSNFASNEEMYAKLQSGGADYDIIVPSDYMISRLINEGMLAELDFSNIPNYELIDERFRTDIGYDPEGKYSVPYFWGTTGIIYNSAMVDDPVDSWGILWNPKYKNQIFMFDNPRDAFGVAQKLLGFSFNGTDPAEWTAAAEKLKEQKPLVQAYAMDQILEKMGNDEGALAPYYSGDSLTLRAYNENIRFSVPKEGANLFVDAFCVPATSKKKAAAEAYINFMCRTDIALENAIWVGYSSPQKEAAPQHREYLLEEYGEEGAEIAYPTNLTDTEVFVNLPTDISLLLDELWITVKVGSDDNPLTIAAVILAFFLVWMAVVIVKRVRRKKEAAAEAKFHVIK